MVAGGNGTVVRGNVDSSGILTGSVTSGGFSPSLEKPIAMATVAAELARPGTQLIIDVRGRKIAATVTPMPFVPHHYQRKGAA